MNAFNRFVVWLLCLGWIATLGAAVWLIWDQARIIDVDTTSLVLNFDIIANTRAEQILATIIAGVLMLPAVLVLGFEMKPSPRREGVVDADKMQDRIDTLEKDLAEERARNDTLRNHDSDTERPSTGSRRWHLFPRH